MTQSGNGNKNHPYNNRPNNFNHKPYNQNNNLDRRGASPQPSRSNGYNNQHHKPPRAESAPARYEFPDINLGLLFNKLLYIDETPTANLELKYGIREKADEDKLASKMDALYQYHQSQLKQGTAVLAPPVDMQTDAIRLKTIYPGLYAGLGYSHGLPKSNIDTKNGFSFDYTSGLPVLPASSVKGCLRSGLTEKKEDALYLLEQYPEACDCAEPNEETLSAFVNTLFGPEAETQNDAPMQDRIIFFDAYPEKCDDRLLGADYITPHTGKGLVEPRPIKMLKVCGGVTWCFPLRFPAGMAEAKKNAIKQVFTLILTGWGVGAKTNVGYGNLIEI